jgi:hypothetical protein
MAIDKGFLVPIQDILLKDARTMILVPTTKHREKEGNKTTKCREKEGNKTFYLSQNIIHQKTYHHATLIVANLCSMVSLWSE